MGMDAKSCHVPDPVARIVASLEEPFVREPPDELRGKEGVSGAGPIHQLRDFGTSLRAAGQRVADQVADFSGQQRREKYLLDVRRPGSQSFQPGSQRTIGFDLVASV